MGMFSLFSQSNTLYFPGCVTYFKNLEYFELYKRIFAKLGIGFKEIEKKVCCGLPALEAGYESDARKLARRNFEIFKEEDIDSIITNMPCCYRMFKEYSELLPDWNIPIINIWELILNRLERKPRLIRNKAMETVTLHDSCYLGRYSGIYDAPRRILEALGYEIKELSNAKENSVCCGGCGGLPRTNKRLADEIAREKILQAKRIGVRKMIVSSVMDYQLLKRNAGSDVEVMELADVLAIGLGIRVPEKTTEEIPEEDNEDVLDLTDKEGEDES
jgi:Fe-S oxidoreductase